MPTAPDPNSPFMDTRLQAEMGPRTPGTPTSAGKPGPQAADFTFPAPPAPAAAPPGRPAAPIVPQPAQVAKPAAPAQVAAAPAQPAPASTSPGATVPPPGQLTAPTVAPDGTPSTTLTPEGDQRFRQQTVELRTKLGPIPKVFKHASLPEMPVELGKWNYNPFSGHFTKG